MSSYNAGPAQAEVDKGMGRKQGRATTLEGAETELGEREDGRGGGGKSKVQGDGGGRRSSSLYQCWAADWLAGVAESTAARAPYPIGGAPNPEGATACPRLQLNFSKKFACKS